RFVATVVGSPPMNFIPCTAAAVNGALKLKHPSFEVEASVPGLALGDDAGCFLGVRPEDVHIMPSGSGIPATVYVTEPLGGETVVDLQLADRVVKALAPPSLELVQDAPVRVSLDPLRLHVFTEGGETVLSAAGADVFSVRPAAS